MKPEIPKLDRPRNDPRLWAKRLIDRHGRGEHVNAYALECAREALNLPRFVEPAHG